MSVFSFEDHREFLRAAFESQKGRLGGSLSQIATKLGFGSPNYVRLILAGKRNLTIENLVRVSDALGMTFEETQYFEALVLFDQASSDAEKKYYGWRLSRMRTQAPSSSARVPSGSLFTEWYIPAILVAVDGVAPAEAFGRVSKLVSLDERLLKDVISALVDSGLLETKEGVYRLSYSHQIFHDMKSRSVRHKEFLLEQLDLSKRMLQRTYDKGSKFYSHTFTVSTEDFNECNEKLRSLLADFTARSDRSTPENVAQLNMQFFKIDRSSS